MIMTLGFDSFFFLDLAMAKAMTERSSSFSARPKFN